MNSKSGKRRERRRRAYLKRLAGQHDTARLRLEMDKRIESFANEIHHRGASTLNAFDFADRAADQLAEAGAAIGQRSLVRETLLCEAAKTVAGVFDRRMHRLRGIARA